MPVSELAGVHDCSLGPWGPYNKRYFGISHLPGAEGVRVDWIVVPELHRRRFAVPSALREAGYLPWQADPELKDYSYLQQILEKDELYADIRFQVSGNQGFKVTVTLVNQTGLAHDVRLHLATGLQSFATGSWLPQPICSGTVKLPAQSCWVDALDYAEAGVAELQGCAGLANDARRQGEVLQDGLVDGQGMRWAAGRTENAFARYRLPPGKKWKSLQIRAVSSAEDIRAELQMGKKRVKVMLKSGMLGDAVRLEDAEEDFILRFPGNQERVLDGFVLNGSDDPSAEVIFPDWNAPPQVTGEQESSEIRWPALPEGYRVSGEGGMRVRRLIGDLEACLLLSMHNHVSPQIEAQGPGEYVEFILPMISVPAAGQVTQSFTVGVNASAGNQPASGLKVQPLPQTSITGDADTFGVERLAAVLFTNVVYPVRIKGRNIRHYPPGRWWDSLYTWDCGFIGLGMAEISPRRAVEMLNTYLTEEDDTECAFVHHGSPVPVQFYLYFDLWQKTQDREMLAFFYPRLRKYLLYLAGKDERSPTRPFAHHLLQTWKLFYNSGGWDDYPPQQYLTNHEDERDRVCPMVVTSHVAAACGIMEFAAVELGLPADEWQFLAEAMQQSMEQYAWDPESGLYGYVKHDNAGNPAGLLHHDASGESFNRGLDGAAPLLAGGCAPERADAVWGALEDEKRFLTAIGLSTVDMQAPYYSREGYWNGAVWIPYQYLFFRSALDYGRSAFALKLAERVLACWERETRDAYACFEHFMIDSGRGAGWHHFGGLSSPVLNLFAALAVPGRLTTGFRTLISEQQWSGDLHRLECRLKVRPVKGGTPPVCMVCVPGTGHVQVNLDGETVSAGCLRPGLLTVSLKASANPQHLTVSVS